MKLTVLTENTSSLPCIGCEHGLSLYIEAKGRKILFDCGQTDLFEKNAAKLGVDLSKVDFAVISHGHYDHGGGLERFMQINPAAGIYMSSRAYEPYYSSSTGVDRFIGLDKKTAQSDRIIFTDGIAELDGGFTLISAAGCPAVYSTDSKGLKVQIGGKLFIDNFDHEQYLSFDDNGRKIVISGCSHKGILNIMEMTAPDILIGGLHFMGLSPATDAENLTDKAKKLLSYGCRYYTCHCTGTEQYEFLRRIMGDRINYISSGDILSV